MDELTSQLGKDFVVIDSSKFESVWKPYHQEEGDTSSIAGLKGYYSYRMHDGYHGQRAIIKGIWSTVIAENKVFQEGFYLHDRKMLLAFFIHPNPSSGPKYIFIINNDLPGYFPQYEA